MKSWYIIFTITWFLYSCTNHSSKRNSVFEQSFNDKSELLANGFKQFQVILDRSGKNDTEILDHLYVKDFGDTIITYGINDDNSVKMLEIFLQLKKTDTIALYKFLHKIGFEEECRPGNNPPIFFTNKNIKYRLGKYNHGISFTRWVDTSKHLAVFNIGRDSAVSNVH